MCVSEDEPALAGAVFSENEAREDVLANVVTDRHFVTFFVRLCGGASGVSLA